MHSLRTDAILEAYPAAKRLPLNLIRERRYPSSFHMNLLSANPQINAHGSSQFNSSRIERSEVKPNSQYSQYYEDKIGYVYKPRRASNQIRQVNYDAKQKLIDNRGINQIKRNQEVCRPMLATGQKKHLPQINKMAINGRKNLDKKQYSNDIGGITAQASVEMNRSNSDAQYQRKSECRSHKSKDSDLRRSSEGRRLFRKLGFNIITNRNCQYLFECKESSFAS